MRTRSTCSPLLCAVQVALLALTVSTCGGEPQVPTTTPVPSAEDRASAAGWLGGGTWRDQHEAIRAIGRTGPVELVFLGDSITQGWGGRGRQVASPGNATWQRHFAPRNAANFGISGDRTQHVLWRIENGAFEDARPRLVVLLIGTNNVGHDPPEEIARGIEAIVTRLVRELAEAQVLLLGVFPRGKTPDDPDRAAVRATNAALAALGELDRVTYRDLSDVFLQPDGRAHPERLAPDHLHLTPAGYAAWAAAIESDVARLMGETTSE